MAYDKRFKERVLEHLSKGKTQEATAKLFGIGTTTLKEWKRRSEAKESLEPKYAKDRQRNCRLKS